MLISRRPLFVPDFRPAFFAVPAIAGRIGKLGKCVSPRFAKRYISEITAGAIILSNPALSELSEGRIPPPSSLCFDNAIAIGDLIPATERDSDGFQGLTVQFTTASGETSESRMEADLSGLEKLIVAVSAINTIKMGDIVMLPCPARAMEIKEGDVMRLYADGVPEPLLYTKFK